MVFAINAGVVGVCLINAEKSSQILKIATSEIFVIIFLSLNNMSIFLYINAHLPE